MDPAVRLPRRLALRDRDQQVRRDGLEVPVIDVPRRGGLGGPMTETLCDYGVHCLCIDPECTCDCDQHEGD